MHDPVQLIFGIADVRSANTRPLGWYKMAPAQNVEPQLEPETSVNVSRRPFHHHRMRVPQRCPLHRSKLPGPHFV